MNKPGAIVLAAGQSSRMGQPKQLIPWKGLPLVVRAVRAARQAGANPVWVVTGAHAEQVESLLDAESVEFVPNRNFSLGIGSSITAGFEAVAHCSTIDTVFLLLCDQPAVHPNLLLRMQRTALTSGKGLVACAYAGTMGPPLLVARRFFGFFAATSPESGAKRVLEQNPADLELVPFEAGARDLDRPEDLA